MQDKNQSKRIVAAIMIAFALLMVMIICLAILLAMAWDQSKATNQRLKSLESVVNIDPSKSQIDYVQMNKLIESAIAKMPAPQPGKDGKSVKGDSGEKGDSIKGEKGDTAQVDYLYVSKLIQDAVEKIPKPKDGLNGKDARQVQFDMKGHWRLEGDDEWLPLFNEVIKNE